jgi:5-methylthioadenosine/S-adenosylhomocysteine deaminase
MTDPIPLQQPRSKIQDSLYTAAYVFSHGGFQPDWALVERDGLIVDVGPADSLRRAHADARVHDFGAMALVPGSVNAHTHSFQSLLRGLGDDLSFTGWRDVLYRYSPEFGPEEVRLGGLLAFGEMALRGVTTALDFFYIHHADNAGAAAVVAAAEQVGIRLLLLRSMMDSAEAPAAFRESVDDATMRTRDLIRRYAKHPTIRIAPAPHSPHRASAAMVQAGAALADELGTPWHIHLAEAPYEGEQTRARYGLSPLAWLDSLSVLSPLTCIVHGVWLDDAEIIRLGEAGGALVHCPSANLFLGDGMAPLPKYLAAGVPVALGTDSGSANSHASVFGEMRQAALLQKGLAGNAAVLTAHQVFQMGTAGGARVSGLAVGALTPGYYADFVALDLADLSLQPAHRLLNNVVYAMQPTAIRDVYVGGRAIVQGRRLCFPDADRLPELLARLAGRFR